MVFLIGLLSFILIGVVAIQIGKVAELSAAIKGEEATELESNKFQAAFGLTFVILFLASVIWSFMYYRDVMVIGGWSSVIAASEHKVDLDYLINVTGLITGIVFFITHILLFWYAWKYRARKNTKAIFWAHNTQLEIVWMSIPALAMAFLVIQGIATWNKALKDIPADAVLGKDFIEVEATGMQYAWMYRDPGLDGQLGEKYFTNIDASNPLGMKWEDKRNLDDIVVSSGDIVLPLGKKVRVRITSRDVLHNFYLSNFGVKMDAVPGMPTYFVFTPTVTTDSMRTILSRDPAWQVPSKSNPDAKRWETFEYELACAELCGKGHYSMRRIVKIVPQKDYEAWVKAQISHYDQNIKGTDNDPFKALNTPVVTEVSSTDTTTATSSVDAKHDAKGH